MPVTAFTTARIAEFKAFLAVYRTSFDFRGQTVPCISDPLRQTKEIKPNNYQEEIPSQVTIWKTAPDSDPTTPSLASLTALGFDIKSRFTLSGFLFEVDTLQLDDVEPTVVIIATRKQ